MFKRSQTGSTQSGKKFRINLDKFVECENSPLLGESKSEEERRNPSMPRGVSQSYNQGTSGIPHPTSPSPPLPPPHTPTPPPPPPPP